MKMIIIFEQFFISFNIAQLDITNNIFFASYISIYALFFFKQNAIVNFLYFIIYINVKKNLFIFQFLFSRLLFEISKRRIISSRTFIEHIFLSTTISNHFSISSIFHAQKFSNNIKIFFKIVIFVFFYQIVPIFDLFFQSYKRYQILKNDRYRIKYHFVFYFFEYITQTTIFYFLEKFASILHI